MSTHLEVEEGALAGGAGGGEEDDGFGAFADAEPLGSALADTQRLAEAGHADAASAALSPPMLAAADDAADDDFGDFSEAQAAVGNSGEGLQLLAEQGSSAASGNGDAASAAPLPLPPAVEAAAAEPHVDDAAQDDDDFGDFAEACGEQQQQSPPPAQPAYVAAHAHASGVQEHSMAPATPAADGQSAHDDSDDGFGDFSEAQAAPGAQQHEALTVPAQAAPHTPAAQAERSGTATFASDLSGLKSRAYLAAACRLLANDDAAAPHDDALPAVPALDKLLSGEAGAPAWVPPSPLLLRAAGLAGGRAPASWDAPLWDGSPAQRRIHTLLHVARDEVRQRMCCLLPASHALFALTPHACRAARATERVVHHASPAQQQPGGAGER
jgi:hypothetical protein